MADLVLKRIQRELQDITDSEKTDPCGIKMEPINGSAFDFKCEIAGPPDTPYEGGKFELQFKIPSMYPFRPPEVKFLTKVWHPNICSESGDICLDILGNEWTLSFSLRTILLSIQALLATPEPADPHDIEAGLQFQKNSEMFKLTASHWTNVYAGGPSKNESFDHKVRQILEIGFSEDHARVTLSSWNWDLETAINNIDAYCYRESESEDNKENNELRMIMNTYFSTFNF